MALLNRLLFRASYLSLALLATVLASGVAGQNKHVVETRSDRAISVDRRVDRLDAITIARHDTESELTERLFHGARAREFHIDLELGETIENQMILLKPIPGDLREFKIAQQFETSMAVGDEGPHVDLVNWKHYTSEWKEIEKVGEYGFLTSKIAEADSTRFPAVNHREIYRAVLKEGGKRWANLARECTTPFDGPCYVGVSRISFRISASENGVWREIHRINVAIALGC